MITIIMFIMIMTDPTIIYVPFDTAIIADVILIMGFLCVAMPIWMEKADRFVTKMEKGRSSSRYRD